MKNIKFFNAAIFNVIVGALLGIAFGVDPLPFMIAAPLLGIFLGSAKYFAAQSGVTFGPLNYLACETLITESFLPAVGCSTTNGGMYDDVYVINVSEITSFTAAATLGRVSAVTMSGSTTAFKFQVMKDTFFIKEELQEDGTFLQVPQWTLANDTHTQRNWIQQMKGSKVVFVGRSKNGTFPMAGVEYRSNTTTPASSTVTAVGCTMKTNVNSWGKEDFGAAITFNASGVSEMIPYFFITSEAASITALEALL